MAICAVKGMDIIMNNEKLLIIHMDDIGMNYACNEAARDLFGQGIVTSASIMVPCAWSYDFIRWWMQNTQYDIGIHTTLTCEWKACRWRPLSDRSLVPGLVDRDGFMHAGNECVLAEAAPEEIYREIRAQVEQAITWGLRPTHIDRHMYTAGMCPEYFEQFIRIAEEIGLPYQMMQKEYDEIDRLSERVPVRKLDGMISSGEGTDYEAKKASLMQSLGRMQPGLYQLTIHPVKDTPEIREIIPEWRERHLEYRLFMDEDIREQLDQLGIRRLSWRDIV
jgi:predicted glycoside hydrolase/deacetylase ChbG (UPF0249 family)